MVAELATFPPVVIVFNLSSEILPANFSFVTAPRAILSVITAPVPILAASTAPSVNFGAVASFEPAKSPPNWIIPFAVVDASGVPAETADFTKAVVAISVLFVPDAAVGAVGVPVKAGEAKGAAPATSATGMLETEERVVSDPLVI